MTKKVKIKLNNAPILCSFSCHEGCQRLNIYSDSCAPIPCVTNFKLGQKSTLMELAFISIPQILNHNLGHHESPIWPQSTISDLSSIALAHWQLSTALLLKDILQLELLSFPHHLDLLLLTS